MTIVVVIIVQHNSNNNIHLRTPCFPDRPVQQLPVLVVRLASEFGGGYIYIYIEREREM